MIRISNSPYHIKERKNIKIIPNNLDELITDYPFLIKDLPKIENFYDSKNDEYDYYNYDNELRKMGLDFDFSKINIDPDTSAYNNLINQGRAEKNGIGLRSPSNRNDFDKDEGIDNIMLYYSSNGVIVNGFCDYSFNTIDSFKKTKNKKYKIS